MLNIFTCCTLSIIYCRGGGVNITIYIYIHTSTLIFFFYEKRVSAFKICSQGCCKEGKKVPTFRVQHLKVKIKRLEILEEKNIDKKS